MLSFVTYQERIENVLEGGSNFMRCMLVLKKKTDKKTILGTC